MSPGQLALDTLRDPARAYGASDAGADELQRRGYVAEEHLISGQAAGAPFTTRVLVRRPADPAAASGILVIEPMHMESSRPVWATIHGHLLRRGHSWMEVACQYVPATEQLIASDRGRYAAVHLATGDPADSPISAGADPRADRETFIASWWWASPQLTEILGSAVAAARQGRIPGLDAESVVLAGISQTGGIVRRVAAAAHRGELTEAAIPDGLLAANSGGATPMASSVPAIELLAEADLEWVRAAAGLPGQGRGLLHRQLDSATFRLYEVAGMSHVDSARVRRHAPEGKRWSRFPHAAVFAAVFENLIAWLRDGCEPPPGRVIDVEPGSEQLRRDELGHALGGVRSVATDLPRARLEPIGDCGRVFPFGCETPLTPRELAERYGSDDDWRERARARAAELVAERFLLADAVPGA